jgi:thiamine biosynthesis lipoprotein
VTAIDERRFAAMGTRCRVVVVGAGEELADEAQRRVLELESRWSRFRPDSELSALNTAGGSPCVVSDDTFELVAQLVAAWWSTGGRFDPTLHDRLLHLGYERSWPFTPTGAATRGPSGPTDVHLGPGCAEVVLQRDSHLVWLPPQVRLDPGGLGKGLAADLVAGELMAAGAVGALVDLGGDLRVVGSSPEGETWRIDVEHPGDPGSAIARVETSDGAVATSSRRRRRWTGTDGAELHHLLDPDSGRPAEAGWTSATALARTGVEAEVGATVAFLDGSLRAAPRIVAALLAADDGATTTLGRHPELFRVEASR